MGHVNSQWTNFTVMQSSVKYVIGQVQCHSYIDNADQARVDWKYISSHSGGASDWGEGAEAV